MKNYLLEIICTAAPEGQRGQDAVEHAIESGQIQLTYRMNEDLAKIRAEWDNIVEGWNRMTSDLPELKERYEYEYA